MTTYKTVEVINFNFAEYQVPLDHPLVSLYTRVNRITGRFLRSMLAEMDITDDRK